MATSTRRCFQIRLSVSSVSYSSSNFGKRLAKSSRKSSREPLRASLNGLICAAALPLRLLVLRHAIGQIAVDAARPVVGRVHARTGNRLVGVDQVFALTKGVEHHGHRADVETVTADPQQVIQDARDFVEHHPDVLRTDRHLDLQQALDGHAIGVFVAHHRHVVETVHVRHRLNPGLRFGELLCRPMEQTDMRIGTHHDFAVKFQDHSQHAVRGRVLRPEVQR
jgi:hypothetical protein